MTHAYTTCMKTFWTFAFLVALLAFSQAMAAEPAQKGQVCGYWVEDTVYGVAQPDADEDITEPYECRMPAPGEHCDVKTFVAPAGSNNIRCFHGMLIY